MLESDYTAEDAPNDESRHNIKLVNHGPSVVEIVQTKKL